MAVEKNNLKSTLIAEGITQEDLAKAAGVTTRTVGKACNNVRVSGRTKRKIIKGLNEIGNQGPYSMIIIFPNGPGGINSKK